MAAGTELVNNYLSMTPKHMQNHVHIIVHSDDILHYRLLLTMQVMLFTL